MEHTRDTETIEHHAILDEQASRLEHLMPMILRRLFTLGQAGILADMPLGQLRICSFLQNGPRSMSAIADEMGMSTSAVTQIADRMERAGLVERLPVLDDRRSRNLHLTVHANRLMEARRESRTLRAREALALMPQDIRADMVTGLEQLLQATLRTSPPISKLP